MTQTITLDGILQDSKAEPRPYQERVITTVKKYFDKGIKTCLVNSPTGSGKTVMGMLSAALIQKTHNIGVGWCAMRRNLLTQAKQSNEELMLGVDSLTPISMFDKNPPTHDAKGRPIKLLVVDEAQHDAASSMGHLHNTLQPNWVLGLSATPYRTDQVKLCFEKIIQDAGIHQLMEQGYLAKFHQYTIPNWDVDSVVERYIAEPDRWGKSVMYWLNRHQMMDCYNKLEERGVRVKYVTGDQSDAEREDLLERFDTSSYGDNRKESIDVLVNMFILTEGWDCTSLKTAFVRDSQRGPTIQMSGRAFRKSDTTKFKQIVQSKHTKWPIQRTATPVESYVWTDESDSHADWRSVKPSKRSENVASRVVMALAQTTQQPLPAFLLKNKTKKRNFNSDTGLTDRTDRQNRDGAVIH